MEQQELEIGDDTRQNWRNTDPDSSEDAGRAVQDDGSAESQRRIAEDLVYRYPGHTSMELAHHPESPWKPSKGRYILARRLPELTDSEDPINGSVMQKGRDRGDPERRKCSVSDRWAVTWWPTGRKDGH